MKTGILLNSRLIAELSNVKGQVFRKNHNVDLFKSSAVPSAHEGNYSQSEMKSWASLSMASKLTILKIGNLACVDTIRIDC